MRRRPGLEAQALEAGELERPDLERADRVDADAPFAMGHRLEERHHAGIGLDHVNQIVAIADAGEAVLFLV